MANPALARIATAASQKQRARADHAVRVHMFAAGWVWLASVIGDAIRLRRRRDIERRAAVAPGAVLSGMSDLRCRFTCRSLSRVPWEPRGVRLRRRASHPLFALNRDLGGRPKSQSDAITAHLN